MAKRRLADEYDAAQERGEVRSANERTASNAEAVGVADLGLTHKNIHEARIIRDAEKSRFSCTVPFSPTRSCASRRKRHPSVDRLLRLAKMLPKSQG